MVHLLPEASLSQLKHEVIEGEKDEDAEMLSLYF
jgi:hypothetical protein